MTEKPDLISLVCDTTLRHLAEQVIRLEIPQEYHEDMFRWTKQNVKDGWAPLVAELKEANEAFHGNAQMLAMVLNVGCLAFVSKAVTQWRATAEEMNPRKDH